MKKLLISALIAVCLVLSLVVPVFAADPEVSITMSAKIVAITNTEASWAIGPVDVDDVVWFSVDGSQDDDYSQIENTGNVAVDVEIQGTDAEGGAYDWTLASSTGDQTYSLYANNTSGGATYSIEVKSSSYVDIVSNLPATGSDTYDWSMKFTAPTAFNGSDDGSQKTATVTLVASEHT